MRTRGWSVVAGALLLAAVVAQDSKPSAAEAHPFGRSVYAAQACWQCHRQAKDTKFPRLIGTRRAGPVLDRARIRRSRGWRKALFWDPRMVAAEAVMPAYRSLFRVQPKAAAVRAFLARHDTTDGSADQDGLVTRGEFERAAGASADWAQVRANLDTNADGVVSAADAAPVETKALSDLLDYLEAVDRKPLLRVTAPASPKTDPAAAIARGETLYQRHCVGCHGERGDGNGPAAMFFPNHPPRNFLRGNYKFRSTGTGEPPTDQDLFRTIRIGAGGSMPAWPQLTTPEIWDLVAFVKSQHPAYLPRELSVRGRGVELDFVQGTAEALPDVDDASGAVLEGGRLVKRNGAWWWKGVRIDQSGERDGYTFTLGRPVYDWMAGLGPESMDIPAKSPKLPPLEETLRLGAAVYEELGCAQCHGATGRGDGPAAATTRDGRGRIIRPTDYTAGVWKGGARPPDLVRTLWTGLSGTPMPSYASNFARVKSTTPELAPWVLARYLQSQAR